MQHPRLERSGLKPHFATVIISEEVGVAKPDAGIFDIAFTRMNQPAKNEVLIIGDSLSSDIIGGINYGIDTCWFNPDTAKPLDLPVTCGIETLRGLNRIL